MFHQVKFLVIFLLINFVTSKIGERCSPSPYADHPLYMEHPNNCTKFLACGNGFWYEMECPARLHYNAERQVCDWPSEAHCKSHHSNSHQALPSAEVSELMPYEAGSECTPSSIRNYPRVTAHSNDCRKFLICNRQWIEMDCPHNLLFSTETLHCEYPENAKCCATCEVSKRECEIDGSRFANNCESFFECQNGKLVEFKCSENQHYDPIKGMCMDGACHDITLHTTSTNPPINLPDCPIDGALFPNYQDCTKFFICNGGTLIDQSCPPSTYYSIAHNDCEDKADAICAS